MYTARSTHSVLLPDKMGGLFGLDCGVLVMHDSKLSEVPVRSSKPAHFFTFTALAYSQEQNMSEVPVRVQLNFMIPRRPQ